MKYKEYRVDEGMNINGHPTRYRKDDLVSIDEGKTWDEPGRGLIGAKRGGGLWFRRPIKPKSTLTLRKQSLTSRLILTPRGCEAAGNL
jgi:hypothetical protein